MSKEQPEKMIKFNFEVPASLVKEVKQLALDNDMKIKDIGQILLKLGIKEFKTQNKK